MLESNDVLGPNDREVAAVDRGDPGDAVPFGKGHDRADRAGRADARRDHARAGPDRGRLLPAAVRGGSALFTREPAAQQAKLAAELNQVLRSIRHHDEFLVRAGTLGRQHNGCGVRPKHHATARTALMGAVAHELGDRWTEPVATAWTAAYDLTTEAMLAADEPAPEVTLARRR
jgi:Globin